MSKVPTNFITNTYGVNNSFSKKVSKTLGLNIRLNLSFLKSQHIEKLNSAFNNIKTGKTLKQYIKNSIKFNKTLKKKSKNSNFSALKSNNDAKKNKKNIKKNSKS